MRVLRRIAEIVESAAAILMAAALAGFAGLTIVDVFARYFLGMPLFWRNEAATYLFIYSVFLGGSIALYRGELMAVVYLRDKLPPWLGRAARLLSYGLVLVFTVLAMRFSWTLLENAYVRGSPSPALEIPMWIVYLPIPLGFALMTFFTVVNFFGEVLETPRKIQHTPSREASGDPAS